MALQIVGSDEDQQPRFNRGDHVELANWLLALLEMRHSKVRIVHEEGHFFGYDDSRGIFARLIDTDLSCEIYELRGARVGSDSASKSLKINKGTITGTIDCARWRATEPNGALFFQDVVRHAGVSFADCYVRVEDGEITTEPHSPDHRARYHVPHAWRPGVKPSWLLTWFDEVFPDEDQAAKVQLLREFIGACMAGVATTYQRALVLTGRGSNGKSTLVNLFERLFPPEFRCALPLHDLSVRFRENFKLPFLVGRLINLAGELSFADVEDSANLKAAISGDQMAARQLYQQMFEFRPIAGHVFATNELPATRDYSHGFWRRFAIIPFEQTFSPGQHSAVPPGALHAEIPSIASWCVEGLAELQRRGKLIEPTSSTKATEEWKMLVDPVKRWIADCCVELAKDSLLVPDDLLHERSRGEELYQAYKGWSQDNGHLPLASNKFVERLKSLGYTPRRPNNKVCWPLRLKTLLDEERAPQQSNLPTL